MAFIIALLDYLWGVYYSIFSSQIILFLFASIISYRNYKELFNLQCWALTADSFFSNKEWEWILKTNKYNRDYELIYFS